MKKTLGFAALAATISLAAPAFAQAPGATAATPPAGSMPSKAGPEAAMPSTAPTNTAPPTTQESGAPATAPSAPASEPATGTSTDTSATASAGVGGTVATGMSVKDNTGALIGEVSSVKDGVATIKMGADTFTVDTAKLGVASGSATINATQADISGMLKKK